MAYVYIRSEPSLWTVGFYREGGKWEPESDHGSSGEAAARVRWLNGVPGEPGEQMRAIAALHCALCLYEPCRGEDGCDHSAITIHNGNATCQCCAGYFQGGDLSVAIVSRRRRAGES